MVKAIIYLLFSFRGRINRRQWWFGILASYLLVFIIGIFSVAVYIDLETELSIDLQSILGGLIWIPSLWILLALHTKRHHDRNRPGWWTIIAMVCAIPTGILFKIIGLHGIIVILWIVFFGCLPGDAGKNRYGPPPKPLFKFKKESA